MGGGPQRETARARAGPRSPVRMMRGPAMRAGGRARSQERSAGTAGRPGGRPATGAGSGAPARAAAHRPAGPRGPARGRAPGTRCAVAGEALPGATEAAQSGSCERRGRRPGAAVSRGGRAPRGRRGLRPEAPHRGGPGVPAPWGQCRRAARAPPAALRPPSPPHGRGRTVHARTRLPRCPRRPRDDSRRGEDTQDGCRGDRRPRGDQVAPTRAPRAPSARPLPGQGRRPRDSRPGVEAAPPPRCSAHLARLSSVLPLGSQVPNRSETTTTTSSTKCARVGGVPVLPVLPALRGVGYCLPQPGERAGAQRGRAVRPRSHS